MLSKAEILYLQGEKQFSASYEYKLKSILKKKITNFLDKELPLLTSLFPDLILPKFVRMNLTILLVILLKSVRTKVPLGTRRAILLETVRRQITVIL